MREFKGWFRNIVSLIAIATSIYHIYIATFGFPNLYVYRSLHILLLASLGFLFYPATKKSSLEKPSIVDYVLVICTILSFGYVTINAEAISAHLFFVYDLSLLELIMGLLAIAVILEITRRIVGKAMSIICLIFLSYCYFGQYIPGLFRLAPWSPHQIVEFIYYSTDAIFGIPIYVSAAYIFLFVIFGALLYEIGAGNFFIQLATASFGKFSGGSGKVAMVASALLGTVLGGASACVYTIGSFMCPHMKKVGYDKHDVGGIIAAAATGAEMMPPVMGAAAFIMAEFMRTSYFSVAAAAALPAILYYFSIFTTVHWYAKKRGGLTEPNKTPPLGETLKKGWQYFIPILVIIYFMATGTSIIRAVLYAIVSTIVVSFFHKESMLTPKKLVRALENSAKNAIIICVACAAAGIVIGSLSLSGLGLKLTQVLLTLSMGIIPLALVLLMGVTILLGMGMPPSGTFVMAASLGAPTLISLGIHPMASYMFILYFATISLITPPVAIASYVAATVAEADIMKTSFSAVKFALAGFLVPFVMVYRISLLLIGSPVDILYSFLICLFGVALFSAGIEGWLLMRMSIFERLAFIICGILLISPGFYTDSIGFVLSIMAISSHYFRRRQKSRTKEETLHPIEAM
ncbi:MAG: TRAP transporter fused permease subunit [Thermoplasmata archaeon]